MNSVSNPPAGLVIAGGQSQRFGGDKALALLAGRTLLAHAVARLSSDCAAVAVNAAPGSAVALAAGDLGVDLAPDPVDAPRGPLAGVLAGLVWARERGASLLLTLPCDTPLTPPDLCDRLTDAATGRLCAVARTPDGVQSLCAAWSTDLIAPLEAHLAAGDHPPVHRVLQAHGCAFVDYPDAMAFLNINTVQDLAEAERRLSASAR